MQRILSKLYSKKYKTLQKFLQKYFLLTLSNKTVTFFTLLCKIKLATLPMEAKQSNVAKQSGIKKQWINV